MKVSFFHLERLRNYKSLCGMWAKIWKFDYFPTLLSHFSNYDYRSANHQCISLIYTICESFSFPSWTVKKLRVPAWNVSKNMKIWIFSNSAQSFFQLWLPQCKSSIYQLNLHNLWKFQLSIFNGLEMLVVVMCKAWKPAQSWKKICRVGKIDENPVFRFE